MKKSPISIKILDKLRLMDQANFTTNQEHIVNVLLKKNPKLDEGILRKAIAFIADAHDGQFSTE